MSENAQGFFTRFVIETRDTLRHYVRKLVRSEDSAEEIVQEAFLRTYEKRDGLQTPRAFLFTTARNLAADQYRRDRNTSTESGPPLDSNVTGVQNSLEEFLLADESSRILRHALELLPAQQQAVLSLRVLQGHSDKEISEILGLSRRTVEQHIAKAMLNVKKYVRARYSVSQDG